MGELRRGLVHFSEEEFKFRWEANWRKHALPVCGRGDYVGAERPVCLEAEPRGREATQERRHRKTRSQKATDAISFREPRVNVAGVCCLFL